MEGAPRIRVLVVDDHVLFTQGLTAVLEQDSPYHKASYRGATRLMAQIARSTMTAQR